MNFKLVSKNNMGIVATLVLVILLSQARFFNFLIETPLGRAILILFILGISYTHKILGVVAVLFIIIMFNQSNIGYIEGYTGTTTTTTTSDNSDKDKIDEDQLKLNNLKLQNVQNANPTTISSTTTGNIPTSSTTTSSEPIVAREGFNTIDRESTILRGKRSNEVPVFSNDRTQNDDIEPTDMSVFSNTFSSI
jgi:hypothetical protein